MATPDYRGAAEQTANSNYDITRLTTLANRPDLFTPLGSQTWTRTTTPVFNESEYNSAFSDWQSEVDVINRAGNIVGSDLTSLLPPEPNKEDFFRPEDQWTSNIELSPEQQGLYDSGINLQQGLADIGQTMLPSVQEQLNSTLDIPNDVPTYQNPEGDIPQWERSSIAIPDFNKNREEIINSMMERTNRNVSQDRATKQAELISRGIPEGSEAYNREMRRFDERLNDARTQAEISATNQAAAEFDRNMAARNADVRDQKEQFVNDMVSRGMSREEAQSLFDNQMNIRNQKIKDLLLERTQPINELSAFLSNSQVNMPQFQAYGQQQNTGGTDYLSSLINSTNYGIAQDNMRQARSNNILGGLFDLGSAYIGTL